MAKAIAFDLTTQKATARVTVVTRERKSADSLKKWLKSSKVSAGTVNLRKEHQILKLMKQNDCAISAVPYNYNYILAKNAVKGNCHFVDLGGNNTIVQKEFSLHSHAKKQNVTIIPDSGLAPGLVSNLTALGLEEFSKRKEKVQSIKLRVGGLPQHPRPPLNYMIVFSVNGLINEYVEPVQVIDNYKLRTVNPLGFLERIHFPGFANMEAFSTSGGTSTLPQTFKGKIKTLDYKTIRYPGHAAQMQLLMGLGLTSSKERIIQGCKLSPRSMLQTLLNEKLSFKDKDVVLLKVILEGKRKTITYELVDYEKKNLTAMMRCTGFSTATIAEMIMEGTITNRGVLKHELDIPPKPMIDSLRKKGLDIKEKISYR